MHDSLFDPLELDVLRNSEFFDFKARIDDKINALFGQLKAAISAELDRVSAQLPPDFPMTGSRIYRGEHHGPYPWRAVDCPVGFHRNDHLAFRCLLLWGHHFSFHLLLSGIWLERYLPSIVSQLPELARTDLQLSVQDSPWQWEFSNESHQHLGNLSTEKILKRAEETGFLKLSRLHALTDADTLVETGLETWKTLMLCLLK